MKKYLIILVFLTTSIEAIQCQSCLPDGIELSSQYQIDQFKTTYPQCSEIAGDVLIKSADGKNIINLYGLNNLTSIKGGLFIVFNDNLSSLSGLNNLKTIEGGLTLSYNPITDFSGLDSLTSVGGWVGILYSNSLISLSGLNNLTSIGGGLSIQYNANLESITSLSNLKSIGNELRIHGNMALTSLRGLENIAAGSISNLVIADNYTLATCAVQSVCNYLGYPGGTVEISNNYSGCQSKDDVKAACGMVSVSEPDEKKSISVFPNPSSSIVTFKTPLVSSNSQIAIIDLTGHHLDNIQISMPNTEVDISALPPGVYFVRFSAGSLFSYCKLIRK